MPIAALAETNVVGRTFLAMDGADATQRALLEATADAMGVKRSGSVPAWLAALVAGAIGVETLTLDIHADNAALLETGVEFLQQAIPPTGCTTSFNSSGSWLESLLPDSPASRRQSYF